MNIPEEPIGAKPAAALAPGRRSPEDAAAGTAALLHEHFSGPAPLRDLPIRPGMRQAVISHYGRLFGVAGPAPNEQHRRWLYRLEPLRALPPGSTVLDLGGGWGLDSLFLAVLGMRVVFYQRGLSEIAVLEFLASVVEPLTGRLPITAIRADRDGEAPFGQVDAVLVDERARLDPAPGEIAHAPPSSVLARAASIVRRHGHVFVLAKGGPGRTGRAFRCWRAAARTNGLSDIRSRVVCTRWQDRPSLCGLAEAVPGFRGLLGTDVAFDFVR